MGVSKHFMRRSNILYLLILAMLFSCNKKRSLDGNYSVCKNGKYMEIYFKKDSMRMAYDNYWVQLSKWRKIEIKNDTLYFRTFGEWQACSKAKIKYVGIDKIEMCFMESYKNLSLERMNENPDFENSERFWAEFKNRQNSKKCK
jgi:hypothetical protein